jgi:hypothetical protein
MGGGITYIQVPTNSGQTAVTAPTNTTAGQAHYALRATATSITLYATVNLPSATSDSFYHQITGLTPNNAWTQKTGMTTTGFQEINLGTLTGAVVGTNYTLKIMRGENGAQFDRFRLVGGNFINGGPAIKPYNLATGKTIYEGTCGFSFCHGGTANSAGLNNTRSLTFIETNTVSKGMPLNGAPCLGQCVKDVSAYIYYTLYAKPEPF